MKAILGLILKPWLSSYNIMDLFSLKSSLKIAKNMSWRVPVVKKNIAWDKNQNHFGFQKIILKI